MGGMILQGIMAPFFLFGDNMTYLYAVFCVYMICALSYITSVYYQEGKPLLASITILLALLFTISFFNTLEVIYHAFTHT